jgi:hypothetical protein
MFSNVPLRSGSRPRPTPPAASRLNYALVHERVGADELLGGFPRPEYRHRTPGLRVANVPTVRGLRGRATPWAGLVPRIDRRRLGHDVVYTRAMTGVQTPVAAESRA